MVKVLIFQSIMHCFCLLLCRLTPLQKLISPGNISTKALARVSLKSSHSPEVQNEQFQSEQNTKAVLKGMPSPLSPVQTSLHIFIS